MPTTIRLRSSVSVPGSSGCTNMTCYVPPSWAYATISGHRPNSRRQSWFQCPTLELLSGCPEVAEVVNGRPDRRERERLELFVAHPRQVLLGGDADADVWVELLAAGVGHEGRDVVDCLLIDL